MYDPRAPNSYDLVVQSRLADEAERGKQAALGKAAALAEAQQAKIIALASQIGQGVATANLTPEEMRKQRLNLSVSLGVPAAIEMQREEHDAAVKERKALGLDSGGKASRFLAKLGVVEGQAVAGEGGLANHLVNVKSNLGSGATVLVPAAASKATPVRGKPSATLLIRNVADLPTETLAVDIQTECAKFGVVRAARVFVADHSIENPFDRVRVFMRFDSVANAFKASEALNGRNYNGRPITVSFFPTALMEKGTLEPQPDEDR